MVMVPQVTTLAMVLPEIDPISMLPATAAFLRPGVEARDVPVAGLTIAWTPPAGKVAGYVVEIEQDELNVRLEATLPGSATSFPVPGGFLRPGTEYDLGIGTVSAEGNLSFVETSFTGSPLAECAFLACDLTAASFADASLESVAFDACVLLGTGP